ncbi:MAG: glutathione S-transferase family protein [Xanthomonadales bacterium]|nr:glutathione S-transferase family protein [Xanthomonadales bacterium]
MQLVGYLDSPYVRRTAITMRLLGIDYQHRELSIFRQYDEFRALHPSVKVPLLILDDGTKLIDSNLIIDYLQTQVARRSLMPPGAPEYREALRVTGLALVGMEKVVQLIYEAQHRPEQCRHEPWKQRIIQQFEGSVDLLEQAVAAVEAPSWLHGPGLCQSDIATAVLWRFMQHNSQVDADAGRWPALAAFSHRAEALPEFMACPLSG